ncbi:MAG TPA: hypothetical protein VHE55_03165 [Fimbriimonadaceae bacterium]|nr:hypothetical protein [Fimbriimonadaceae bacterium]
MEESLRSEMEADQDESGIDLFWIRYNRSLTPAERVEKHRKAAESVLYLKDVAKRAKHPPTGESPRRP